MCGSRDGSVIPLTFSSIFRRNIVSALLQYNVSRLVHVLSEGSTVNNESVNPPSRPHLSHTRTAILRAYPARVGTSFASVAVESRESHRRKTVYVITARCRHAEYRMCENRKCTETLAHLSHVHAWVCVGLDCWLHACYAHLTR